MKLGPLGGGGPLVKKPGGGMPRGSPGMSPDWSMFGGRPLMTGPLPMAGPKGRPGGARPPGCICGCGIIGPWRWPGGGC